MACVLCFGLRDRGPVGDSITRRGGGEELPFVRSTLLLLPRSRILLQPPPVLLLDDQLLTESPTAGPTAGPPVLGASQESLFIVGVPLLASQRPCLHRCSCSAVLPRRGLHDKRPCSRSQLWNLEIIFRSGRSISAHGACQNMNDVCFYRN